MKKLLKKKLNVFGKEVSVLVVGLFAIALVSAALVPYISNTINGTVDISSPITITATGGSNGVNIAEDELSYSIKMYGGESKEVNTLTEIHVDGVTGHIAENKISGFDGEGITIQYRDDAYPGYFEIPLCVVTNSDGSKDSYFYIGDPSETLNVGNFESTTTFTAALNLDPTQDLTIESQVIMETEKACDYEAPIHVSTV